MFNSNEGVGGAWESSILNMYSTVNKKSLIDIT